MLKCNEQTYVGSRFSVATFWKIEINLAYDFFNFVNDKVYNIEFKSVFEPRLKYTTVCNKIL